MELLVFDAGSKIVRRTMTYLFVAVEVALTWRDSDSVIGIGKVETLGGVEPWKT